MKRQPIGRLVGIAVVIAFFLAACSGISPSGAVSSATPERAVSGATAPAALSPTATQAMPSATPTEPAATATQMIPSAPSGAPAQVRLITSDIDRFWAAYDRATLAGSVSRFVFIRKITWRAPALGFAILRRRASRTALATTIVAHPKYYAALRRQTSRVAEFRPQIEQSFQNLKRLYPDAVFPNVYFVVGRLSTGGTVSQAGLLIGIEMYGAAPDTPLDELKGWNRLAVRPMEPLPFIVAHELIHAQQKSPIAKTLLDWSILEGGADFLGELISDTPPGQPYYDYGDEHEQELWIEFQAQMDGTDVSNWLSNGDASKDRPADLGYYVGYKIAEVYYQQATDKRQAVRNMLEIHDFHAFLDASGYAAKFQQ
jgi:hypothetical protein